MSHSTIDNTMQVGQWSEIEIDERASQVLGYVSRQEAAVLTQLHPSLGIVLIAAGIGTLFLPGPGTMLIVSGSLMLAPHISSSGKAEMWLHKFFPGASLKAVRIAQHYVQFRTRFRADLEKRYPNQ